MEDNCRPVSLCALVSSIRPFLAQSWWSACCAFSILLTCLQGTPLVHLPPPAQTPAPGHRKWVKVGPAGSLPRGLGIERESCRAQWSWTGSPELGQHSPLGYGYRGDESGGDSWLPRQPWEAEVPWLLTRLPLPLPHPVLFSPPGG